MVFCNNISNIYGDIIQSHNPYFNRWFSAIKSDSVAVYDTDIRHNPYFNRWFSAICYAKNNEVTYGLSQSLF